MWTLPRKRHSAGYVLDLVEFNANMTQFANEVDGGLNEHNFATGAIDRFFGAAGTLYDEDIGISIHFLKPNVLDPHLAVANLITLPHSTSWNPVAGVLKTFVSHGGTALVLIPFQITCPAPAAMQSGLNFAIGFDGAVQMQSLLGSGDLSNDFKDPGEGVTVAGSQVSFDYGTSPSVRAVQMKLMVSGLIRIPPGRHTIQLYSRNLFTVSGTPSQYLSQHEIIVIEGYE